MNIKAEAIRIMWALIKLMKTQKAVARALGQSKQTFNYWLNHANKVPYDQLLVMKRLLKKELEREGKNPFATVKDIPLDTESLVNSALTISHKVELAIFYEELFGNRRGQRSDINNSSDQPIKKNHKIIHPLIEKIDVQSNTFSVFGGLLSRNFDKVKPKINLVDEISSKECRNKFVGRTDEVVAKLAGFNSKDTFRFAKKVVQSGMPELIKAMDSERVSISQAYQVTNLPIEIQKGLLQKNRKEISAYLKKFKKSKDKTVMLNSAGRVLDLAIYQQKSLIRAEKKHLLPLRFVFASLVACCDEYGGFNWQPAELKALILPYIDLDFSKLLEALLLSGLVQKDELNGRVYGRIPLVGKYIREVNHATLIT